MEKVSPTAIVEGAVFPDGSGMTSGGASAGATADMTGTNMKNTTTTTLKRNADLHIL